MSENNTSRQPAQQTFLQKYDMLVDCLSFEHIEKCSNKKELEKILKILRSGEEGFYPDLEKAAEENLRKLSPNNHLLRVDDPVIPTSALSPEHRQLVSHDVQKWANEMVERDKILKSSDPMCSEESPAIRNVTVSKAVSDKNKMNKFTSKSSEKTETLIQKSVLKSYDFWDKFDADNEISKMDLEEERCAERKERECKLRTQFQSLKKQQEEQEERAIRAKMKDASVGAGDSYSITEKSFNAQQERSKGNEWFRTKDFGKALDHYTKSIDFQPSVDAFNNRAQTYLKLQNYSEAIADSDRVLQLDPHNVKGLYRRGVGKFSLGRYQSALHDFEKVLEVDPNNQPCQEYAKKTCAQLGISASSKRVRMAIQETSSANNVDEILSGADSEDKYYPFFNTSPNENIVLNEIGTAKVMCRCSGTPGFMKKVRSLEDIKEHGRLCLRRSSKSVNPFVKRKELGSAEFVANANNCSNQEKITSGYSFSKFWTGIKGTDDLPTVAKFLRTENPDKVKQVVGQMLDDKMLSLFIMSLRAHFSIPKDWAVIQRYLHVFTQFPRFKCVSLMLNKETKSHLESLLNEAEGHGLRVSDLLQLYGLMDCPQS